MGEVNGIVTEEELQAYGNANIMLLDGASESVGSGTGEVSGSGMYSWTLRWNEDGFMGIAWNVADYDTAYGFSSAYEQSGDDGVRAIFNNPVNVGLGVDYAHVLLTNSVLYKTRGCVVTTEISS